MTLRLTWVQPEDLIGHELRQAAQDGRDGSAVASRWVAAGGHLAPDRAGASAAPASPELRALAEQLLDELAAMRSPLGEPTDLAAIESATKNSPPPRPFPKPGLRPGPRSSIAGGAPFGAPPAIEEARPAGLSGRGGAGEEDSPVDRLHAAWLGRAAGCLLGKPVEKLPLEGIRAIARSTGNWPLNGWFTEVGLDREIAARYPWNRRSAPTSLAENIDGMPEDDDLNYPLLALLLIQRHGTDFTTADVAKLWLDELPAGRTFTAERIAYRNLLTGLEPPHTATYRNPFREWIGAQIRADVFGWINPGDPARAARLAHRDAVLTHTANGVYGAMFTAAAIAAAASGTVDVHTALRTGLTVVPPHSRYAQAVRLGIELAGRHADFDTAVDELHAAYADHHWVHVLPNAALLSAALTHAEGDFEGSICRAVSGGWDTDSNGATAGSIAGLLAGHPDALGDRWTAPLKNRLATTVAGFDGIGFDELARLTLEARA
ncbi:ADP-ribosylglycohydrolase family protein [Streptomyces endophyticus]|uniref:ADP-ribosylglycohydrolase family protein n=1 Tax=Streptomyces endophyticus TaxID=714166 RepID=A0ABU6FGY2_9ACTN|nr:ADP-ribosylglycohydrolase family protein [Streptomyces endophyticus]MEB8343299.1 ADP-ribosylglycohydrolase family protein [Streptomyces endophyticus]